MLLVYQAGAMSRYNELGEFAKATEWRIKSRDFFSQIGIKVFDPTVNFDENKEYDSKGIVLQNEMYLNKADLLLVNLEYLEYSWGTVFEMIHAYIHHKPVIAFGHTSIFNQPHIHNSITIHFETMEETLSYIRSMYCQ